MLLLIAGNEYKEAETFYKKLVSEARGQGLNVPFMSLFPNGRVEFCSKDDAVAKLQNLCKVKDISILFTYIHLSDPGETRISYQKIKMMLTDHTCFW